MSQTNDVNTLCFPASLWRDDRVLDLAKDSPSQYRLFMALCGECAGAPVWGVLPATSDRGLARRLDTNRYHLGRFLAATEALGLVRREDDGALAVTLFETERPAAEPGGEPRREASGRSEPEDPAALPRSTRYRVYGTTSPSKARRNGHGAAVNRLDHGVGQAAARAETSHETSQTFQQDVPQNVPRNVPFVPQNVPVPPLLGTFGTSRGTNGTSHETSLARASENVSNVNVERLTFSSEKENLINSSSSENVNVQRSRADVPNVPQNVPPNVPNVPDAPRNVPNASPTLPRLSGAALIECNEAINAIITLTSDPKSRGWFEKLWKLCHAQQRMDLWAETLKAVRRGAGDGAIKAPGKYFGKTLEARLLNAGLSPDRVVSPERIAEAQQAAAEMKQAWERQDAAGGTP